MPLIAPPMDDLKDDRIRLMEAFDFTKDNFGKRLLGETATAIKSQCDAQADPDGIPWHALSPGYEEWKENVSPGQPIGVLWGLMLDPIELRGQQVISIDTATMTYGVTAQAKIEAIKFQEGFLVTGTAQPPRRFFAIPYTGLGSIEAEIDDYFTKIDATK